MARIFISYASTDRPAALALGLWLTENGWNDYFLSASPDHGLNPGQDWRRELRVAVDRSQVMVLVLSPAWIGSHWCETEMLAAQFIGKAILGVLVEALSLRDLPQELTADRQLCDLVSGADRRDFAVGDAMSPVTVSFSRQGLEQLQRGLRETQLAPDWFPWPPGDDPLRCPYRGLDPLDASDAAVYFGREAITARGLTALRNFSEQRGAGVFVVLGASGAGKSSFLRAGLLPRLSRDPLSFIVLPVIRPGRAVLSGVRAGLIASVQQALARVNVLRKAVELEEALRTVAGLESLFKALRDAHVAQAGPATGRPVILIPVDQAEELFGADGREEAGHFLELLSAVLAPTPAEDGTAGAGVLAILTIRTDAYQRVQGEPLLQGVEQQVFSLPAVERAEYKAIIEGPAARVEQTGRRVSIDPALTERLLQEAQGPDALPLLAFTLERLWINCDGRGVIALADYDSLGGVGGSIERAVAEAFAEPTRTPPVPGDAQDLDRLLRLAFIPWLATIDPRSRETLRRVARFDELPEAVGAVVERLVEKHLLVRNRTDAGGGHGAQTLLEIAHEAMLRRWPKLALWLKEAEADLLVLEEIKDAARDWTGNQHAELWLVHLAGRLQCAERVLRDPGFCRLIGPEGRAYVAACAERDREARARRAAEVAAALIATSKSASQQGLHDRAMRLALLALRESPPADVDAEAYLQLVTAACASPLLAQLAHGRSVGSIAFCADGNLLLSVSSDGGRCVWNSASGVELGRGLGCPGERVWFDFTANGQRVVAAKQSGAVQVWNSDGDPPEVCLQVPGGACDGVHFSPDHSRILTTAPDGSARVWEIATGRCLAHFTGHRGPITASAFCCAGARVLTASVDGTATVWDAMSGAAIVQFTGHQAAILTAVPIVDGRLVVSASADRRAVIWDSSSGAALTWLDGHEAAVMQIALSPDQRRIATASADGSVRLWDLPSGKLCARLDSGRQPIHCAVFSDDSLRLLTGSGDGSVRLFDVASGTLLDRFAGHAGPVLCVVFGTDRRSLASGSSDGSARLWQMDQNRPEAVSGVGVAPQAALKVGPRSVRIVPAAADGGRHWAERQIGWCSPDMEFPLRRRWTRLSGEEVTGDRPGWWDEGTLSFEYSPDGSRLLTTSVDPAIRLLDAAAGTVLRVFHGHKGPVLDAALSPDGARMVSASWDCTARLWDAESGRSILRFAGRHDGPVTCARFSPDGRRIFTGSADATIRVWDTATGSLLHRLAWPGAPLQSLSVSNDGACLMALSFGRLALWDVSLLTESDPTRLAGNVVRKRLIGARTVVVGDLDLTPVLDGRHGEDAGLGWA